MALGWNFTEDELNKIMQEKAKDDLIDFNGFSNYLFEKPVAEAIEEADKALSKSKKYGRNRITMYGGV